MRASNMWSSLIERRTDRPGVLRKRVVLALGAPLLLVLTGCGGGGGGSPDPVVNTPPPPVGDEPVGGIWSGDLVIPGQTGWVDGIVADDGAAYFANSICECDGESRLLVGLWGILDSAGNKVSGDFLVRGEFPDGSSEGTARFSGTITGVASRFTDRVLEGSLVLTSALGAITTAPMKVYYDRSYNWASSLDRISGSYKDDIYRYYSAAVMTVSADGRLFMQDPVSGCVVNGQVSILDPRYTVYGIELDHTGCGGAKEALNGITLTGLAAYYNGLLSVMVTGPAGEGSLWHRLLLTRN